MQIGAYTWAALLPGFLERWALDNSAGGWITGSFYAAYALSVPLLVTLTDRVDPRSIYLLGVGLTVAGHLGFAVFADGIWTATLFRVVAGIGWAGTYMTGLKLLADRVQGRLMSRAVAGHAASIGVAGALSFVFASGAEAILGWRGAFGVASGCAMAALLIALCFLPRRSEPETRRAPAAPFALFDFRDVVRNRSALAYSLAYCVHTWEMGALRGWAVTFLAYVAQRHGDSDPLPPPTVVATAFALVGVAASVMGNELSIRFGRQRLVTTSMAATIMIGGFIGFVAPTAYWIAALLVLVYGLFIWLDSSSLTAGTAAAADPARRGATLALHSMLGYTGGFLGPLIVGWILDLAGGMSNIGWGFAFLHVAVVVLAGRMVFALLRPRDLEGDGRARPTVDDGRGRS